MWENEIDTGLYSLLEPKVKQLVGYPITVRHDVKLYNSNWCFVDAANLLIYVCECGLSL